ncbi:hypothetical protein ACER0C_013204 [Sarotherodon galilaeus]
MPRIDRPVVGLPQQGASKGRFEVHQLGNLLTMWRQNPGRVLDSTSLGTLQALPGMGAYLSHHTPCQLLMPSIVGTLVVLSVWGLALSFVLAHSQGLLGGAWRPWLGRAPSEDWGGPWLVPLWGSCDKKMSSQVRLRLLPRARCLFDEPIKVKVEGLRSRQVVTMRARLTDEKGVVFSSLATYRADDSGEVDLNRDPSLGGTYVGVEPMGLLWSMRADTMHKRFQKTTSLEPQLVNFSVHEEEGRMLAEETNERLLMGDGVSRVLVKEGRISGVLFIPPGVDAAVWINGCCANVGIPLYHKKQKILSPLMYDLSKLIPTESGASIGKYIYDDPLGEKNKGSLIPIEQTKAHFLFVAGEDDQSWDSKAFLDQMVERLKRHGKKNFESVSYPQAGHLLEPPYGPFCPSCAQGIFTFICLWGGEPKVHAAAEVHLWKKIQEFFRTHLSCDAAQTEAKV